MDERTKKKLRALQKKKRQQKILIIKCMFACAIMLSILLVAYFITRSMENKNQEDTLAQNGTNSENPSNGENIPDGSDNGTNVPTAAPEILPEDPMERLEYLANKNGISMEEYPERLLELLKKNPETEEFVTQYPTKKNEVSDEPLEELLANPDEIPMLFQWDTRWGYYEYGGDVMGLTGCGATCMSMVASYLFQDPNLTPVYIAKFSTENKYVVDGGGTTWAMMSTGAQKLGLNVKEVPLHMNTVKKYLEEGHPIICNVGPGHFTEGGHYIVFTGWVDNMLMIHDPNSKQNTETLWNFSDIQDQIKNMWVYTR